MLYLLFAVILSALIITDARTPAPERDHLPRPYNPDNTTRRRNPRPYQYRPHIPRPYRNPYTFSPYRPARAAPGDQQQRRRPSNPITRSRPNPRRL